MAWCETQMILEEKDTIMMIMMILDCFLTYQYSLESNQLTERQIHSIT